jgi:hypothetical protein
MAKLYLCFPISLQGGAHGSVVVKALCYKSEGSEFETGFTQPLAEMSTRSRKIIFLGSKVRLTTQCLDNV